MSSTGSMRTVLKSKPDDIIVQELRNTLAEKLSSGDTVSQGTSEFFAAACVIA